MKHKLPWSWQQKDWPNFNYNHALIANAEHDFLKRSYIALGTTRALSQEEQDILIVELATNEAFKTSEIEGEILNRESLKSSIRHQFGLDANTRHKKVYEDGIAKLFHKNYESFKTPLTHEMLHDWHTALMEEESALETIGGYRNHKEEMRIVSGYIHKPKIHYVAPPSESVNKEMEGFITWFNNSERDPFFSQKPVLRAAIAHWWFVMIHPYEDGNGRISRALVKKVLWQTLDHPFLIALSETIFSSRKEYYKVLEEGNKSNNIDGWLNYFADVLLKSIAYTERKISNILMKDKFFKTYSDVLNARQIKVVTKLIDLDIDGFQGGLNAHKYCAITKASQSTATRDLQNLTDLKILRREGERKGTRYYLSLSF